MESSPSFVKSPEDNGVIEQFFRTMKKPWLWLRDDGDKEALRRVLYAFRDPHNTHWIMQRHGYRTPQQVREE